MAVTFPGKYALEIENNMRLFYDKRSEMERHRDRKGWHLIAEMK